MDLRFSLFLSCWGAGQFAHRCHGQSGGTAAERNLLVFSGQRVRLILPEFNMASGKGIQITGELEYQTQGSKHGGGRELTRLVRHIHSSFTGDDSFWH